MLFLAALEELLPANGSPGRLRRSPSESTIDLHDERGIDRNDLLHEVRQWPDAERLIVSGIGIETVLQVWICIGHLLLGRCVLCLDSLAFASGLMRNVRL